MAFNNPAVSDFKNQFVRDFPYGGSSGDLNTIQDSDISTAFQFVNVNINQCFFADQGSYSLGYLLLAAHNLVLNLRASSQGISGQYAWAQNSVTAGPVSEGFQVPERIQNNPELMMLTKTTYGARYLELILPQLCGQVYAVAGATWP